MPFRKILSVFLLIALLSISVSAQAEPVTYHEIAQHQVGQVHDMDFMFDGSFLAATDAGIWIIPRSLEPELWPSHSPVLRMVKGQIGSQFLLVYSDHTMGLWDGATRTELSRFLGHTDQITSGEFVLQDFLVTGSADNTVRLWNLQSGNEEARIFEHENGVDELRLIGGLIPLIASRSGNSVHLWSLLSMQEFGVLNFDIPLTSMEAHPTEAELLLGTADGQIHVWKIVTEANVEYEGEVYPLMEVPLEGGTRRLIMVERSREEASFIDPENPSEGIIVWQGNWRGLRPASASIEASHELEVLESHSSSVQQLSLPFCFCFLSIAEDNSVHGWDIDYTEQFNLQMPSDAEILLVDFPKVFATVYADNNVSLWSVDTGVEIASILGLSSRTSHIAYPAAAEYIIVSATEDGIIHIWEWDL